MDEPSAADWEKARKIEERFIFRLKEGLAAIGLAHVEPVPNALAAFIALHIADAREEGRREARELCAKIAENHIKRRGGAEWALDEEQNSTARAIAAAIRSPLPESPR